MTEFSEICAVLREQRRKALAEAESKTLERQAWLDQAADLARVLEKLGCPPETQA